jgi:hypothetical protein
VRFSLKWILAGTVYVAIAAAAFGREAWYYSDAVWAMTFLTIVWAILVAIFGSGRRRIAAAGFAVASVGFALCATFNVEGVPTARILEAAGVQPSGRVVWNTGSSGVNPAIMGPTGTLLLSDISSVSGVTGITIAPTLLQYLTSICVSAPPTPSPRWPLASWVRWWA